MSQVVMEPTFDEALLASTVFPAFKPMGMNPPPPPSFKPMGMNSPSI